MSFLLREKALHLNTQMVVIKDRTKSISDNYVVPNKVKIDARLSNIYYDKDKDLYKIVYQKGLDDKKYICYPSDIEEIDGQTAERFYKATQDLMVKANFNKIEEQTNVKKTIIGQKYPTLNGIPLYDGMKVVFTNDKDPEMNMKVFTIKGYGKGVQLCGAVGRPKKHLLEAPKVKQKRGRKVGWRKNKQIQK